MQRFDDDDGLVGADGCRNFQPARSQSVFDCDAKEVRTGLPLAAFRVSGQLFWVLQEHGYEDETYLIAEIREPELRYPIEVNGGGC